MGKEWANLGPARSALRFHTAKLAGQNKVKQWWCQSLGKDVDGAWNTPQAITVADDPENRGT
jgi:hypothetical protein